MYQFSPVSDRVARVREKYRTTRPKIDISRYRLITEFYMENPQLTGILKRAKNMRNLFENMPTPVHEDELIVGFQGATYRCSALYPEVGFGWFMTELQNGNLMSREADPYDIDPEDAEYVLATGAFWEKNCMSAMIDEYYTRGHHKIIGNGVLNFAHRGNTTSPVGHFTGNMWKVVDRGMLSIKEEAEQKMAELEENGIFGQSIYSYNFYRAVSIVCGGIIHWSERYAAECARQAAACEDPVRKAELEKMADSLNWIMKNPCRDFHDAVQAVYLYQLALCMDGQQHGISFGRVDQFIGKYYEKDLAEGKITREQAQEIMDLFYLKVAECNKCTPEFSAKAGPGYTSGLLMTAGGVDKDGNDATNACTYMMLESAGRLRLHTPPQALRVHDNMPEDLWDCAIETSKLAGGVPSFEYDGVIIPALMKRGIPLEDARNYCLIGCVEPQVCGSEWAQPGGNGRESYMNILSCMLIGINNGTNPFHMPGTPEPQRTGPETGYLYEMETMEEVLAATKTQIDFFCKWQVNNVNAWEYLAAFHTPLPLLSATIDGCMESGKDVMWGGAKYNSTGNSCIGLGNLADSLNIIDYMCFREKLCTTREMYDALMNNWEGFEEMRQFIKGKAPHYGNADEQADKYLQFAAHTYYEGIHRGTGPRGNHYQAGCYPVTLNVGFGKTTAASPDGRKQGEPLSDGISPLQGMDKNGPISTINSILKFDQTEFGNGTLCNMKFHPTALRGENGNRKLQAVMQSYFEGGGMELQLNIISADTLKDAQENPDNYRDLVVRVAGFSAYFVEVFKDAQDDLISRTEMAL